MSSLIWKTVVDDIDNLSKTWSQLIRAERYVSTTIRVWEPDCAEDGSSPGGFYDIGSACRITGGQWVDKPANVLISRKHDGVIERESGLWHKNDQFIDDHNRLFDDVPEDGGYNHFELRNYYRDYTLKNPDGSDVFEKGDANPSMEEAENWLKGLFGI